MKNKIILTALLFSLFFTATAHAGKILTVVDGLYGTINVRKYPSIRAPVITSVQQDWPRYGNTGIWVWDQVEYLNQEHGGWIKIQYPVTGDCGVYRCDPIEGWVYGEFFGIAEDTEYENYENPIPYVVTHHRVLGRYRPSMIGDHHEHYWDEQYTSYSYIYGSYTFKKGTKLTVIGRMGNWLHIHAVNGKIHNPTLWVYHELAKLEEK